MRIQMSKQLSVILATIASVLLIFCLLFGAMEIGMSDKTFINNEYTKLGLSREMGMNNVDLVNSCIRLIDYMKGDVDSIDITVTVNGEKVLMFDQEQEVSHMKDVQTLYLMIKQYRNYAAIGALVLYLLAALLAVRNGPLHSIGKGYIWGTFIMMLILGFVGTWAALDFDSFWTMFHQSLFWNDDWLFDPTTSRMINLLPSQFFQDLVIRIVLYAIGAVLVLLIIAIIIVRKYNKKKQKEEEIAIKKARARRRKAKKLEAERQEALLAEEGPESES